jgi:flagellar export protein FliJ
VKPFRFTLEKVLSVRRRQTLGAQKALSGAQMEAAKRWSQLEGARVTRTEQEQAWTEKQASGRVTARQWKISGEHLDGLRAVERQASEALQEALAEVAAKRAELEEASRREKALEKLRQQQLEAHQQVIQMAEQAAVDEMAQTARWRRKERA